MKRKINLDDRGQVLVQVALGLVVLLLVVGLAIDGGNVYGERRAMQNAADAGALAGARAICEGLDESEARGWAEDYAERNGADLELTDVDVDMEGGAVNVTAGTEAATFLMRLAGEGFATVEVGAEAEAMCSLGDSIAGLWPIAFDVNTWEKMFEETCKDGDEYGAQFLVWVDDNIDQDMEDLCDLCDCEGTKIEAYGGKGFGPGDRGWVRLQNPPEDEGWETYQNADNCGASALNTWLEYGYSGPLAVDDCVATQPGVTASGLKEIEYREGAEINIILFDTDPICDADEVIGYPDNCPGDFLRVKGFGCVKIDEMDDKFTLEDNCTEDEEGNEICEDCPVKNEKVIFVTMKCDCEWESLGATDGGQIGPGVPAVSLTK